MQPSATKVASVDSLPAIESLNISQDNHSTQNANFAEDTVKNTVTLMDPNPPPPPPSQMSVPSSSPPTMESESSTNTESSVTVPEGKLFIGGISWRTSESMLHDYFIQYGSITEIVLMTNKYNQTPRGFGFITFTDATVLPTVLGTTHIIDGRQIEVKKAISRDDPAVPPRPNPNRFDRRKIFVGGLAPTVTDTEFRQYFEKFGTIIDAVVMVDRDTSRSRGFGFVTYDNEAPVQQILTEIHIINDKKVEIKSAEPKLGENSSGSNHPHPPFSHPHPHPHHHSANHSHHQGNNHGGNGGGYAHTMLPNPKNQRSFPPNYNSFHSPPYEQGGGRYIPIQNNSHPHPAQQQNQGYTKPYRDSRAPPPSDSSSTNSSHPQVPISSYPPQHTSVPPNYRRYNNHHHHYNNNNHNNFHNQPPSTMIPNPSSSLTNPELYNTYGSYTVPITNYPPPNTALTYTTTQGSSNDKNPAATGGGTNNNQEGNNYPPSPPSIAVPPSYFTPYMTVAPTTRFPPEYKMGNNNPAMVGLPSTNTPYSVGYSNESGTYTVYAYPPPSSSRTTVETPTSTSDNTSVVPTTEGNNTGGNVPNMRLINEESTTVPSNNNGKTIMEAPYAYHHPSAPPSVGYPIPGSNNMFTYAMYGPSNSLPYFHPGGFVYPGALPPSSTIPVNYTPPSHHRSTPPDMNGSNILPLSSSSSHTPYIPLKPPKDQ